MNFQNRTAVITGAAGRIGQATAEEFVKHGVRVFLADINMKRLEPFAEKLRAEGAYVSTIFMDVADPGSIRTAAEQILAESGSKVDILVNNAGRWPAGSILQCSDELWTEVINLNLNSVFRVTQAFLGVMTAQQYGRIINLGSIAGEVGLPGLCAYSAAKGGVIMLTKTIAMELSGQGITVNSVSPGMIADEKMPCDGTWLGRYGTGDEIARAIAFLASDDSSFITGVDFPVDGGRILGPKNAAFQAEKRS
ncbi:MAG: SDR family oxidoreductase [Lentisphaeria bacterium]|nr:SDR family oxidoreductase [Lentisphaeria bacterium]